MSDEILNQLECFKAYLASGRAPRWSMGPADVHGFLIGLAIAGPLPQGERMPWIWSGKIPRFISHLRHLVRIMLTVPNQPALPARAA